MELQVKEFELPKVIEFNFDELKEVLTAKTSYYETLVYSDAQITEAKADRAELNKFKKALNDERIRREKEYMVPFNDFKKKIGDLIAIIDKPVAVIDKQIKSYEEEQRNKKLADITDFWENELREDITTIPEDWLKLTQILDTHWLNSSYSMTAIKKEIRAKVKDVNNSLMTLASLPEFGFEATEEYKRTLDLNRALNEGRRLAEIQAKKIEAEKAREKARAEEEAARKAAEDVKAKAQQITEEPQPIAEPEEEPREWVTFTALLNREEAGKLADFFISNSISFKAVKQ